MSSLNDENFSLKIKSTSLLQGKDYEKKRVAGDDDGWITQQFTSVSPLNMID